MRKLGIGMVGCGVVGGGVLAHLTRNRDLLQERSGVDFEVVRVAVRDLQKARGIEASKLTTSWREVVEDPQVNLVVEMMGGTTLAREVAEATLKAGKPLVTANKALLAECGEELFALAERNKVPIYFEASVAGGIPILKALREGLRANHILGIHGIINGTCNYILSRMADEGKSYEEILLDAKRLGYAEADESLDVDGIDAAHKAAILASLAYGFWVRMDQVYVEGIRKVSALDMCFAKKLGYTIKLLATIQPNSERAVEVRVHPTLIPSTHVLASVSGAYNAIAVEGDVVGNTLFYGRGAGPDATASAVLSDMAEAGIALDAGCVYRGFERHSFNGQTVPMAEVRTRYYFRLTVLNKPGVLARVAALFGAHDLGISSVFQPEDHDEETVPLVILLDYGKESSMRKAYDEIMKLDVVQTPCQMIRVEDFS
ncbi:MAG: homoserine dehydrogenase [Blastochloris sp.]|nr:homoserine dehydrogenase [Blastochloris sp.]